MLSADLLICMPACCAALSVDASAFSRQHAAGSRGAAGSRQQGPFAWPPRRQRPGVAVSGCGRPCPGAKHSPLVTGRGALRQALGFPGPKSSRKVGHLIPQIRGPGKFPERPETFPTVDATDFWVASPPHLVMHPPRPLTSWLSQVVECFLAHLLSQSHACMRLRIERKNVDSVFVM